MLFATFALSAVSLVSAPAPGEGSTQDAPTFSEHIAPILYENCAGCHRPGEMAPMSLLTYADARPWARSIREVILEGSMPPWHAEAPVGTFRNERHLRQEERLAIVEWVDAGSPEGDPSDLPPAPEFATGWTIGTPDAVVSMPVDFEVPARGEIPYQYFQVTAPFDEDTWVQAVEIRPGEPAVVHHVLVYSRRPDREDSAGETPLFRQVSAGFPSQNRREGPVRRALRGLTGSRERRSNNLGDLIATTAPGTNAQVFGPGQALRIPAGSLLTFQVHYTANGTPTRDRSRIGFIVADGPPQQEVRVDAFVNAAFTIPPGAPDHRVDSAIEFLDDAEILAVFPHTHLRGKSWEYRMVYPDGRTRVVLSVPEYDFDWQTYYHFSEPVVAPKGSRLEATAHYDNSPTNPNNPDPDVAVRWGDQTWEEMQYSGIILVQKEP